MQFAIPVFGGRATHALAQAAIRAVRPTVYVDIASMGDSLPLPRGAAAALAADGARPLIFALTQPGALSPQEAYEATDGRCIFADRELVGVGL